jgi:hypothetical protein
MSDRQIFDYHTIEIARIMREHAEIAAGKTGAELLAVRRAENAALMETCARQKRALALLAGDPIEPEMHFGEAVLLPAFGGGG